MKFLHLADLHIGKRIHEYSMLDDQRIVLEQIERHALAQGVDAVVIAGDVYDKPVPSGEAVEVFDSFLTFLQQSGIAVLLIGGNHDSGERLDFARAILQRQNVTICGRYAGSVPSVTLSDVFGLVRFHLLPYLRPNAMRQWHDLAERTSQCAVQTALTGVELDPEERHVLLAHEFVTAGGAVPLQSDSEIIPVGGLDAVDAALFDGFAYVALGHLHRPQKLGRMSVRYAGSPLKYSFSEKNGAKSVPLVELKGLGEPPEITLLPLIPRHDMRELRGTLEQLLSPAWQSTGDPEDYLRVVLTDELEPLDAVNTLRGVYPNVMQLAFDNSRTRAEHGVSAIDMEQARHTDVRELFEQFFLEQNGHTMTEEQRTCIGTLCREEDTL